MSDQLKQTLTTVLGIIAIAFGAIGFTLVGLRVLTGVMHHHRWSPLASVEMATAFLPKLLLIVTGTLLLLRSRVVIWVVVVMLVISAVDSVLQIGWLMPPLPRHLDPVARAGRMVGWMIGMSLPLALYTLLIVYLKLPRTKMEFGDSPSETLPPLMPTPPGF